MCTLAITRQTSWTDLDCFLGGQDVPNWSAFKAYAKGVGLSSGGGGDEETSSGFLTMDDYMAQDATYAANGLDPGYPGIGFGPFGGALGVSGVAGPPGRISLAQGSHPVPGLIAIGDNDVWEPPAPWGRYIHPRVFWRRYKRPDVVIPFPKKTVPPPPTLGFTLTDPIPFFVLPGVLCQAYSNIGMKRPSECGPEPMD
jgi:hypothetical protein